MKLTGSRSFTSKFNESDERERINSIYSENYKTELQGSDSYVKKWTSGKKHDPCSILNERIRAFIRATPGTTKGEIITHFTRQGFTKNDEICGNLRELHKMGLFNVSS